MDQHQELPDPLDLPVEDDRITFVGLPPEGLDPVRFSAYGLDEIGQAAVKDLCTGVATAVNGFATIHSFMPVTYDLSRMTNGLRKVVNRVERMVATTEPVGYLVDDIDQGLEQTRAGLRDLVVDIKARDIENPVLQVGIFDLDKGLSLAANNLTVLDDGLCR